jgi:hypothetical protein
MVPDDPLRAECAERLIEILDGSIIADNPIGSAVDRAV